jgi:hypothetical protein
MQTTKIEKPAYCFPVQLETLVTKAGQEYKRGKAVVRTDTGAPISLVGPNYNLIPHEKIFDTVRPFLEKLGRFTERNAVDHQGSRVTAIYDFKDQSRALKVGDVVGLRMIGVNTYDGTGAFVLRMGGMVLKCLNGMTTLGEHYSIRFHHSGFEQKEIVLPEPELVYDHFVKTTGVWDALSEIEVDGAIVQTLNKQILERIVLSKKSLDDVSVSAQLANSKTAWDLYNAYTYGISHTIKGGSLSSQIMRSDKLNRIFSEFAMT